MSRRRGMSKRAGALAAWDMHYGPNMTPMVDVVMVILIFFMTSSAILGPEWLLKSVLPVNASPPVATDTLEKPTRVNAALSRDVNAKTTVRVQENGANETDENLDQFFARLARMSRETTPRLIEVLLKPDPAVAYGDIVRIHETCQKLGIEKVGMQDAKSDADPSGK